VKDLLVALICLASLVLIIRTLFAPPRHPTIQTGVCELPTPHLDIRPKFASLDADIPSVPSFSF
jgi:hypothetical protein